MGTKLGLLSTVFLIWGVWNTIDFPNSIAISEGTQTSSKATADIIYVMHSYFAVVIREYRLRDSGELGLDTWR